MGTLPAPRVDPTWFSPQARSCARLGPPMARAGPDASS